MEEPLRFASATLDDVPAIETLVRAAYSPYIERIGREPAPMTADYAAHVSSGNVLLALRGDVLVGDVLVGDVLVGDVLVGALVTEPQADHLLVENVAVDPIAQGQGIGGRLLVAAEQRARTLGLHELRLYTNELMTENLSYYPRRGYRETDRRTEDGFARVFFSRTIDVGGSP